MGRLIASPLARSLDDDDNDVVDEQSIGEFLPFSMASVPSSSSFSPRPLNDATKPAVEANLHESKMSHWIVSRKQGSTRFDCIFFPSLSPNCPLAPLGVFFVFPLTHPPSSSSIFSQATTTATTSDDPRSASPDVAQRTAGLTKRRGSNEQQQQQEQQPPQLERNSGGSPRTVFGEFFLLSSLSEEEGIETMMDWNLSS